ncbi:hypothetical protein QJS04_geneDACA001150 [Acorus gramineus]|uniref:Reverse transcriptase zinc-binding domain-containing protein n=1 Tax=Acorus gramineus TaxID=55184 RepID=A0AAV9AF56_ACOGR|nr:hypothetical protein QJS04_geneDACA001150 [Acorus gramineus]
MIDTRCALCCEEDESGVHLFVNCSLVRRVWYWLHLATGLSCQFASLDELWAAGKALRNAGDRSVRAKFTQIAKVTQIYVPVTVWAIWCSRNNVIFRGETPYAENIWELSLRFIQDWGRFCAGATSISLQGSHLSIQE